MASLVTGGCHRLVTARRKPSTRLDMRAGRGAELELAIALPRLLDGPIEREPAVVKHRGAGTELTRRVEAVRHVAEWHTRPAEIADAGHAFRLEALVAHRQHLVDDEDLRLDVLGDGEPEPRVHA